MIISASDKIEKGSLDSVTSKLSTLSQFISIYIELKNKGLNN